MPWLSSIWPFQQANWHFFICHSESSKRVRAKTARPVSGGPHGHLRLNNLLKGLRGLSIQLYSCYNILQQKDAKQNQQRDKVLIHGVKSRGDQAQASKSLLLVESHRIYLILPATSYDNTWNVICQGSSLEIQCPGNLLRSEHVGILYVPKFQTQKKSISYIIYTNSWGTVNHSYRKSSWNLSSQMPTL